VKTASVLLLCLATVSCEAQYKAPVNIAFEVYKGCILAEFQTGAFPESKAQVEDFLSSLDQACINWTAIWTPTLIDRKGAFLNEDEAKRLDIRRVELLTKLDKELTWTIPK